MAEITNAHTRQFFDAVRANDTRKLMELVLSTHCDPRLVRNDKQQTLLHFACQLNHSNVLDMVRTLIEIYHCDPLLRDQHLLMAYHYACLSGNMIVLSYLFRSRNYHYVTDFIPPSPSFVTHNYRGLKSELLFSASKSGNIAMTRFTFMLLRSYSEHVALNLKLNLFIDAINVLCKLDDGLSFKRYLVFEALSEDSTALYEACCAGNLHAVKFYLEELRMETRSVSHQQLKSKEDNEREVYTSLLEAAYRLNNIQVAQYFTEVRGISPVQSIVGNNSDLDLHLTPKKIDLESHCYTHYATYSPLHMAIRSGNVKAVLDSLSYKSHQVSSLNVSNHVTLLHSACISGKLEMVKTVIEKFECNVNACNSNKDTPLHVACEWGHLEICLFLLEQNGCQINATNDLGYTPLMLAIKHNRFEIFNTLLEKGADVSMKSEDTKETCLHLACCLNNSKFALALLNSTKCEASYSCLNASDKYGDTPLFNACRIGNVELVQSLVSWPDCETMHVNPVTNDTPAHIACRINRLDVLKILVREGIDVPKKCLQLNHLNKSLLHLACENDAKDVVNYLIEKKLCDVNSEDCNGRSPLHIATLRGNTAIVKKLLMSHTCKITDLDNDENTILHYLCTRDLVDTKLVATLCEYNTQGVSLIEKQNKHGYTPLHYVCENGGIQVLQCLLEHFSHDEVNATLCFPNKFEKSTPLHLAFKHVKMTMIEYLLKCTKLVDGVSKSLQMQNCNGDNVFHLAMEYFDRYFHNDDGTQSLKTFPAAVIETAVHSMLKDDVVICLCQKNSNEDTPIQCLIRCSTRSSLSLKDNELACSVLSSLDGLSHNSTKKIFSVTSSCGNTLLHLATREWGTPRFEVIKLLVERGICDPTATNDTGETPLHLACCKLFNKASLLLCEHGCDPHQLDNSGISPLFNALKDNKKTLSMLISKGYWKHEQTVIQINSNHEQYGHYYKQIMIHSESVDAPTTFSLPLFHCAVFLNANDDILKQVADIVVKHKIPNLCDSLGNTVLHVCSMCISHQNNDFLKDVLALEECDVNKVNDDHNTPLHIACDKNNTSMVKLLLKCDDQKSLQILNKENHTPLFYAKDRGIINCLIMNGADPSDVAESERVKEIMEQFEKCKFDNPLNPTVTVLVLGNSLAGKTTLIKSLTKAYKWKQINPSIGQISEESERTVGVDMLDYTFFSESNVRLLFYDYAGQTQFHNTNSIHLQNLLSNSHSSEDLHLLFLIVIDITTLDKLEQLKYWTIFIENCKSLCVTGVPDIVVIGSHADKVDRRCSYSEGILEVTKQIVISHTVNFVYNPIFLNCCEPNLDDLKKLKKLLFDSTETLKKQADLDNRCHMVFSYLYKHFPNSPVKFTDFHRKLGKHKPACFTTYDTDYPLSKNYYVDLLKMMHGRQHILLIGDLTEDFWILTARAQNLMFKKIHGLLFAGADFKQHIHIQSNVGVLSSGFLRKTFSDVDYDMLQEFLMCSELCKKIEDEVVLNLIEQGSSDKQEGEMECSSSSDEKTENSSLVSAAECTNEQCYFFFPGLIKATKECLHIQTHENYCYSAAWLLNCTNGNPRFLQVLLLRLMFKFAASSNSDTKLHRECTVWNNGLFWSKEGVEMLVEVIDQNKMVVFFLRCLKHPELKAIELRSAVIREVIEVKSKYCPASGAQESFLCNPSLDERGSLVKPFQEISRKELASAVISGDDTVKDTTGQYVYINNSLLCFEPYAEIDSKFLKSMFDPEQADQLVPDDILSSLYTKSGDQLRPIVTKFKEKISELERPVSYQHLRNLFDKHSVFCGENPKVSLQGMLMRS